MKLVGIHQPNFLPWLGYFHKWRHSDAFVLLDSVEFERSSRGSYVNRVMLNYRGQATWFTVPIKRETFSQERRIFTIEIDESQPWRAKLCKTLALHYGRAPHFKEVWPWLLPLLENPESRLARYNEHILRAIAGRLDIQTPAYLASGLPGQGHSNALLASLTAAVGGTTYLCGQLAAATYNEDQTFASAGLAVQLQKFTHPVYHQQGGRPFVAGLSIVDALFNLGAEATSQLL